MAKIKMKRVKDSADQGLPLRVWSRRGRQIKSPSIRVKCGCCGEAVVIYFDKEPSGNTSADTLEINGVNGTVDQWRTVLLPLLGLDNK